MLKSNLKSFGHIVWVEYIFIYIVLCVVYFFMIPQSDIFLFARETEASFDSVVSQALYYGNGRFVGNIIGMGLSKCFSCAFAVVALFLTSITVLLNKLVFDNNHITVFPVAIIVSFMCADMMSEAYYLLASFCNYVIPCALVLLNALIIKSLLNNKINSVFLKTVAGIVVVVTGVASCLFSENTTAVVFTLTVVQLLYSVIRYKKVNVIQVVNMLSASVGTFLMLFIPQATGTSHKMNHYRAVEISVSRVVANFAKFSEVISNNTLIMAVVSLALVYLCLKKTKLSSKFKAFCVSYFAAFVLFSILISEQEIRDIYIARLNSVVILAIVIYILVAVCIVFAITDKTIRLNLMGFGIVIASSVAPMMIVTQYGYRTYYITAVLLIVFALFVLKQAIGETAENLKAINLKQLKKYAVLCSIAIFTFLGAFYFIQSVYNYDFFVVRTDMICEQVKANKENGTDDYIEVFTLPMEGISIEDEYINIVFDIIDSGRPSKMKTIGILDSSVADEVLTILDSSFVKNLKFAIDHLEYKDPLIFSQLSNKS